MDKGISLYIHIPFCKQKCLYCDFPSFSGKEELMLSYAKALSKELDNIDRKINTIFIGGGTPTYLSIKAWNIIKNSIDKLKKSEDLEFTIEGNPGTFEREKLELFKDMGVNRISIGLQAWQDKHLKSLGRIHSRNDFVNSFNLARKIGFNNINVDLMFGLPNQSLEDWKETLREVSSLDPEHISCYSLIVEESTPFFKFYEEGKLNLPDEDLERNMYYYTLEFLKSKGYYQYEISNFSKINKECKHNLVYWDLNEYLGCGSSAHSYINGFRFRNHEDIISYIKSIEKGNSPIVEKRKNTLQDNIEEFMFMGLRKIKGISEEEFEFRFGVSINEIYGDIIKKYKDIGLLIDKGNRLFLSSRGIEISNTIMADFILT